MTLSLTQPLTLPLTYSRRKPAGHRSRRPERRDWPRWRRLADLPLRRRGVHLPKPEAEHRANHVDHHRASGNPQLARAADLAVMSPARAARCVDIRQSGQPTRGDGVCAQASGGLQRSAEVPVPA